MKLTTSQLVRGLLLTLIFPAFVLNLWMLQVVLRYLQPLVNITVIATLLSFLLDYPLRLLEEYKIRRVLAVLLVLVTGLAIFTAISILLIPPAVQQFNTILNRLPDWINSATQQIQLLESIAANYKIPLQISTIANQFLENLSSKAQTISGDLLGSLITVVSRFLDVLLTLILTFYFLLYGERFWESSFSLIPQPFRVQVQQSLQQNFHNYFIGQATIAGLKGILLTLTFLIIQVPFALLFGLVIGIMAFVPFGGTVGIGIVSFLMILNNFWLGLKVLIAAVLIEQMVENVITPRLMGHIVGLNPILILLSLLIGAKFAGFLGLLIAVPLASFIKSIIMICRSSAKPSNRSEV